MQFLFYYNHTYNYTAVPCSAEIIKFDSKQYKEQAKPSVL